MGVLPTDGDIVIIDSDSVIIDNSTAKILQLQLISAQLNVSADLQITGDSIGIIMNLSRIHNDATIDIGVSNLCIDMEKSHVFNQGRINIIQSSNAVNIDALSSFYNYSEFVINSGTGYGVHCSGYIYNDELFDISSLTSDAIILEGSLHNTVDGTIRIHDLTDSADGFFIYPNTDLENWGSISLDNISEEGMVAMGNLLNHGSIHMTNIRSGIIMENFGDPENVSLLINHPSATIYIDGNNSFTFQGISIGGLDSLNNMGKIELIDFYCTGIFNNGSFVNHNMLDIKLAMTCSSIDNRGLFHNLPSGVIEIRDGVGGISNSSEVINNGQINIKNSGRGINNQTDALFQNDMNAEISLDSISGSSFSIGITNYSTTFGFINAGHISMNHIEGEAILNFGKLHIMSSGSIIGTNLLGDKLDSSISPNPANILNLIIDGVLDLE